MNDTIYRRDAIQALIDTEEIKGFAYRMLEDRLMEIPSADQQQVDGAALISAMSLGYSYGIKANRPQGEWIAVSAFDAFGGDEATWMAHGNPTAFHYCSECKEQTRIDEFGEEILSNFCPICGARMFAKDINVPTKKGADDD